MEGIVSNSKKCCSYRIILFAGVLSSRVSSSLWVCHCGNCCSLCINTGLGPSVGAWYLTGCIKQSSGYSIIMQTVVALIGLFVFQSCIISFISHFSSKSAHNSNKLRIPYPVRSGSLLLLRPCATTRVLGRVSMEKKSLESDHGLRYLRWWGIAFQ